MQTKMVLSLRLFHHHHSTLCCGQCSGGWPPQMNQCVHDGLSLLPLHVSVRCALSLSGLEKSLLQVMRSFLNFPSQFLLYVLAKLLGERKSSRLRPRSLDA
jgi:hypothetical protein